MSSSAVRVLRVNSPASQRNITLSASADAAQAYRPATPAFIARLRNPVLFRSKHRAHFAQIDPFGHMNTIHYLAYFTENRFIGQREVCKMDLRVLSRFPIQPQNRKVELEWIRAVRGDEEFTIVSWLSEVSTSDCVVSATMCNAAETLLSRATFWISCVDKRAPRATEWPEEFIRLYYADLAPE
jgi:acyl-CoA thioesterase FadM